MDQSQDTILTKFKSLQFVSENCFSSLKKLESLPSVTNEVKISSESLNSKFTKMYVSNSNHLLDIKKDLHSLQENFDNKLHKFSEEPLLDNLKRYWDSLSGTLFNNFELFQEECFMQHSDDVQFFSHQQEENFSKLSEGLDSIKNLLTVQSSGHEEKSDIDKQSSRKPSSKSSCHNHEGDNSPNPVVGQTQHNSGYVCPFHDKILELKLDHELLGELNDKVENLIDLSVNPVQALENRFLAFEKESKERFDMLVGLLTSSNQMNAFEDKGKARATGSPSVPQGNAPNRPDYLQPNFPFMKQGPTPGIFPNSYAAHSQSAAPEMHMQNDTNRIIMQSLTKLESWPTFSGEGEYNHVEFIKAIDAIKEDSMCYDRFIVARLKNLFKRPAKQWFLSTREEVRFQSWT
jgi:hypothetical protein